MTFPTETFPTGRRGFTLVEILIVISIIAILMTMIAGGVIYAKRRAEENTAQTQVNNFSAALDSFYSDEGYYPGSEVKDLEINALPRLFDALYSPPKSKGGKGGRSSPYVEIKEKDILVKDPDMGEEAYRMATLEEINDPDVDKYVKDPWGMPLWYRENKSKKKEGTVHIMHRPNKADLWSTGRDKINQTLDGDNGDDIGNW
ncbi:MAG: prepilin-type N-terminal cleavage/methylation domain-containing protein [Planctomycetes bacterium]|nr:prepilin-type N-terminal cleavage/methylation domain-containing protein [Planctomycetota bacterium]